MFFLFVVIQGSSSSDRLDLHGVDDDFQVSFKISHFSRNSIVELTLVKCHQRLVVYPGGLGRA